MKIKFITSILFGVIWLAISLIFSISWGNEISDSINYIYIWWVIIGIALLPGFLMGTMFFSNILNIKHKKYTDTGENTTIIMCAHNEEKNITESILSIFNQKYLGNIYLIVIDNSSDDSTKEKIINLKKYNNVNCSLEYVYCDKLGKFNALNYGLSLVNTKHFITVDADTCLEENAVQRIMNNIVSSNSACVAGNLFVKNAKKSLITKMQNYDYLLSIASIKRFQGSYNSTLVAQGAFSAYHTECIKKIGGWKNCMGEDIVLTYQLLELGMKSTYEPRSVGYTNVPESFCEFYNQRKRWGIGMIEGLTIVPPWKQKTTYSKYFTFINILIIYLDLAFLFGFIPGVILSFLGFYYFVGFVTLFTIGISIMLYINMYMYQKSLGIYFQDTIIGFICFLLFFQVIQSMAALNGYIIKLFKRKEKW